MSAVRPTLSVYSSVYFQAVFFLKARTCRPKRNLQRDNLTQNGYSSFKVLYLSVSKKTVRDYITYYNIIILVLSVNVQKI